MADLRHPSAINMLGDLTIPYLTFTDLIIWPHILGIYISKPQHILLQVVEYISNDTYLVITASVRIKLVVRSLITQAENIYSYVSE